MFNRSILQVGDVLFTRSKFVGSGIAKATKGRFGHVMLYLDNMIIHADTKGVWSKNPQRILMNDQSRLAAYRLKTPLTADQLGKIEQYARSRVGSLYSIPQAAQSLQKRKDRMTDQYLLSRQFCSRLVAQSFAEIGVNLVADFNFCTPNEIAESPLLEEVPSSVGLASAEDIAFYKTPDFNMKIQVETYRWLSRVRALAEKHQLRPVHALSDVAQWVLDHPQFDAEICGYIQSTEYLTLYDSDKRRNPWRYSPLLMQFVLSTNPSAERVLAFERNLNTSLLQHISGERLKAIHNAKTGLGYCKLEEELLTKRLAAGVNFPFQSVLFDRIQRRYIQPLPLPVGSYRNMSGRAGRLGMHQRGYAILVPRDRIEARHANTLVLPQNERLDSKLVSLSVRKIVLTLIASGSANDVSEIRDFLENTLYWYQVRDRNPTKLDQLLAVVEKAIDWLASHEMVTSGEGSRLAATDLGTATSRTGLLPSSAYAFAQALSAGAAAFESNFEDFLVGWLHAACSCDDFTSDSAQRFLPPANETTAATLSCLRGSKLIACLDTSRDSASVNQATFALHLFMSGELERRISASSGISSGYLHRLAGDVAWVLDGVHHLAGVPSVGCSQAVMNHLSILTRRIRHGVPIELVDLIRIARRANVPGFGRQRALALMRAGLSDPDAIINADPKLLEQILQHQVRVDRLIEALHQSEDRPYERAQRRQLKVARELGLEALVVDSYRLFGNDYETPIEALLRLEKSWEVTKLDDGKRQGVPDFLIKFGEKSAVIECKTCVKKPPTISKDEAFAVLVKAADIDVKVHRITLAGC